MASEVGNEKLYPPTISSSIPAFYAVNGTVVITVPFSMNRAVSADSVGGFALKIKTAQSNVWITTLQTTSSEGVSSYIANRTVTFTWENIENVDTSLSKIKLGQYLKFQLAYISKQGVVGFFSTVAIGKYTSKPSIFIKNAEGKIDGAIPNFLQTYTGIYEPGADKSERPYQYCFLLYNTNMELIETTSWKIHNSSLDDTINETLTLNEASDTYTYKTSLEENKVYYIQYGVRTINNLEIFTPAYPCAEINGGDDSLSLRINAINNFDEGYIQLTFNDMQENVVNDSIAVSLQIERSEITDDFQGWKILKKVYFASYNDIKDWSFRDFTVEQGIFYKYRYRLYNSNNVVAKQVTLQQPVMADFEDMFLLGDDGLQLKIRFNPKVSSFKNTILEQKIDTIGSKYPFIFRNGIVSYKEFPISGLISYLADNNEMFVHHSEDLGILLPSDEVLSSDEYINSYLKITSSQLAALEENVTLYYYEDDLWQPILKNAIIDNTKDYYVRDTIKVNRYREGTPTERTIYEQSSTLNSVSYNMKAERKFKMKLLNWLNNGKIKLFRSPAEGNYLVRIMNVSLTPEDRLGRMLHNFSCQAYEIEELSYNSLLELGFIKINEKEEIIQSQETIAFASVVNNSNQNPGIKINDKPIYNMAKIELSGNSNSSGWVYIRVGPSENNKVLVNTNTGLSLDYGDSSIPDIYYYPSDNNELKSQNQTDQDFVQGIQLTYNYLISKILSGEVYQEAHIVDEVYLQNVIKSYFGNNNDERAISFEKIQLKNNNTEQHEILQILTMYFHKKSIIQLNFQNNKYYLRNTPSVEVSSFFEKNIYEIYQNNNLTRTCVFYNNTLQDINDINYTVKICQGNTVLTDFEETPIISLTTLDFNKIIIGNGIYMECALQEKVTKYKTNN